LIFGFENSCFSLKRSLIIADFMKKKYGMLLALAVTLLSAATAFSSVNDSILLKGISLVHQERFDEALILFDSVIAMAPEKPVGYFFKAGVYSNLAGDYRNLNYSDRFQVFINQAVKIGEELDKSGKATAEDLFFYGGALGFRGIYKSYYGDWVGAFKDGLKGRGVLDRALKMDSTNYDIYYGLGMYDYWRSVKTRILSWLPFFPDKRRSGIEKVFLAIQKGKFVRDEAKYALLRVYDNEKDYKNIMYLWENYLKAVNQDDPYALYYVGRAQANLDSFPEAIRSFEKILDVYEKSPYYDEAGKLDVYYNIGVFYYRWGRYEQALAYLTEAKDLAVKLKDRKDVEEAVNNSREYYKKALEASNKK